MQHFVKLVKGSRRGEVTKCSILSGMENFDHQRGGNIVRIFLVDYED